MRRSTLSVLLFFLISGVSIVGIRAEESLKRYRIKSGIVEYTISGMQKGTEKLYFDDWGRREAKLTNSEFSMMGMTQKTHTLVIMDSDWIYSIDMNTKTGTKTENSILKEFAERSEGEDLTEAGEEMLKRMGGRKVGAEEIAGKTCDVWEMEKMNTKTWIWEGITLKTEMKMPGMEMTTIATNVKENAKVSPEYLAVPANVKISEGPDLKTLFQNMNIE